MSYAKAAELLGLVRFIAGSGAEGVTLDAVETRFACDRRRAQRMIAALKPLMPDLVRTPGADRRPRWHLAAAAIAPLMPEPPAAVAAPATPPSTRSLLLTVTERVMREEGYAAISTRHVARLAGLTPAAVHYHFATTDDLLIALYRHTTERNFAQLQQALAAPAPLHALWRLNAQAVATGLAVEFMALANHRKAIRVEIERYALRSRAVQAGVVAPLLARLGIDPAVAGPRGTSLLFAAIARALVMENSVGIGIGHDEARATIDWILARLEPDGAAP